VRTDAGISQASVGSRLTEGGRATWWVHLRRARHRRAEAPWLPLARTDAERALFARIRSALDPSATLNPNILPR
jgi:FAD/FMN-containing dehydrogenase